MTGGRRDGRLAMTLVGWLALAGAIGGWPTSDRAARLRGLIASGRLLASGAPTRGPRPELPLWPLVATLAVGCGIGVGVGFGRSAGVAVGVAAGVVSATGVVLTRSVLRSRADRRHRDDLHLALSLLAGELEAGAPPEVAIAATRSAVSRFAADFDAILGGRPTSSALRPVAVAWRIAESTGAPLAEVLARVRTDIDAERSLTRAVAAAVAGPRSSAALLAVLPLLGVGLGAAMGAHPMAVLVDTAAGRALLIVGVALDAVGVLWTHYLIRRALPK